MLTATDIEKMDYNEIIGVVRETNRPPGNLRSIARIAQDTFLNSDSRVLEIGTSTGITAVELARLTGCHVTAVDINPESLAEARRRAEDAGVSERTEFVQLDATDTGYPDDSFDLVFCGNVTSLIDDRERALAEYTRVVKKGGFVGSIPMYYVDQPSDQLVSDVSAAIQVDITPHYREFWMDFFRSGELVEFLSTDYRFDRQPDDVVDGFVTDVLARPHLKELGADAQETLAKRYREYMHLFNRNLSHMGFTVLILRKESADAEPELFTSSAV